MLMLLLLLLLLLAVGRWSTTGALYLSNVRLVFVAEKADTSGASQAPLQLQCYTCMHYRCCWLSQPCSWTLLDMGVYMLKQPNQAGPTVIGQQGACCTAAVAAVHLASQSTHARRARAAAVSAWQPHRSAHVLI